MIVHTVTSDESVDWDDSDLKYGALPPERACDVSSPDMTNEQRVKSPRTVQKARNFGTISKPRVHKRKRKILLIYYGCTTKSKEKQ